MKDLYLLAYFGKYRSALIRYVSCSLNFGEKTTFFNPKSLLSHKLLIFHYISGLVFANVLKSIPAYDPSLSFILTKAIA